MIVTGQDHLRPAKTGAANSKQGEAMNSRKFKLATSTIIASGVILLGAVGAASAADNTVEEVIVTSQKTSQNVQNVPIAVTAVTAQALETKGINDVSQLSALAPNVTLDAGTPFSGSDTVLSAFIRGIGQNDFAFNQDPGVGVYVDGVYLARSVGSNTSMLDVSRVEILKGPQGTLFGRNTIGGAINIITRDPGPDFMAKMEVTTGSYNRLDVRGTADIPISDKLLTSLSFSESHRDGYQKRIPFPGAVAGTSGIPDCDALTAGTACPTVVDGFTTQPAAGYQTSQTEGGQGSWSVRGKALFLASDNVKFTFAGDYTNVDQSASANSVLSIDPNHGGLAGIYNACIAGVTAPFGVLCSSPRLDVRPVPVPVSPLPALANVNVDGNPNNNRLPYDSRFMTGNIDTTYSTGNSFSRLKNWGLSGTLEWKVAPEATLKSITAYRQLHWSAGMDLDGSPLDILHTSFDMTQHQFSEELQLVGKAFNDRLDYAVGAYYFSEGGHLHDFVTFPAALLMVDGPNDLNTQAEAIYAHLSYKLTDQLSVIAGGRYTWEHKTFEGHQTDDNGLSYKISGCYPPSAFIFSATADCQAVLGFPNPSEPYRYYPAGVKVQNFSNFSPTLGLQFQATQDLMFYGTYSQGFKTGSWTTRLSNPHPTYDASLHFDPEKATTEEIGMKSEWFDRRVRLNVAGFHTAYKNIQLNSQQGISPTLLNAGDARMWGAEAEWQAIIGGGLSWSGAIGYIDAAYTRIAPGVGDNGNYLTLNSCPEKAVLGLPASPHACALPKTPKWKINLGPQYVADLPNGGQMQFNLDWTRTTPLYNDLGNSILLKRPTTDIVNLSATYKAPQGHWEATVGATNLTDAPLCGQRPVARRRLGRGRQLQRPARVVRHRSGSLLVTCLRPLRAGRRHFKEPPVRAGGSFLAWFQALTTDNRPPP